MIEKNVIVYQRHFLLNYEIVSVSWRLSRNMHMGRYKEKQKHQDCSIELHIKPDVQLHLGEMFR